MQPAGYKCWRSDPACYAGAGVACAWLCTIGAHGLVTEALTHPALAAPLRSLASLCSGQIGFMVCTKAAGDGSAAHNAAEPRQPVPGTPEGRGYPPLR